MVLAKFIRALRLACIIVPNANVATLLVMFTGYSIDLRERVLQAVEEGMSKMAAHRTFHISRSTIDHWFALREQTGTLAPRPMRATPDAPHALLSARRRGVPRVCAPPRALHFGRDGCGLASGCLLYTSDAADE